MKNEITVGWRKLRYEELHNLHSLPNIIIMIKPKRIEWAGHVTRIRQKMKPYKIFVGKPEGKRPRCRW
jgi:hypothetical protein